jgi:hypothetical protein
MAKKPAPTTAAGPNKAQAEFEKYTERRRKEAAAGASASEPASAFRPEVVGSSPFPGGGLSWAVPLGVGMAPAYLGGGQPGPGGQGAGGDGGLGEAVAGLTAGIGTTARLGVDLLNAVLFNSVKILGGFTDAYGHGHQEDCGCGGGCGCESCCEPSCCAPDCCGCECCSPGVGSCC